MLFTTTTITTILSFLALTSAAPATPMPYNLARLNHRTDQVPLELIHINSFAAISASAIAKLKLNLGADALGSGGEESDAAQIEFTKCPSVGNVSEITIEPCTGGNGSLDSPCEFHAGENYTITLTFTTAVNSTAPRANLIAGDKDHPGQTDDTYPYSGQSFDACKYTECPVHANETLSYIYNLRTLNSPFDSLTFNATDGLPGPSILCAGFPIEFVPKVATRGLKLPFGGLYSSKAD